MVLITASATAALPSSLTLPQIHAGLESKIRKPQDFVPVIESCTITSETPDPNGGGVVVDRLVKFKQGSFAKSEAREVVRWVGDSWVDFELDDGTHIRNIVSDGVDGGLYITYTFELLFPEIKKGSAEEDKEKEKARVLATKGVQHFGDVMLEMVKDGRISV